MAELPDPPIPADFMLPPSFNWIKLDVDRVLNSDLAANPDPEVKWTAFLSWCRSWKQKPAGSLPDDDQILAHLLGFGSDPRGVKRWRKLREAGALHNWYRCSDGRLYHPMLAEKALDVWHVINESEEDKAADRERKRKKAKEKKATEAALVMSGNPRNSTGIPSEFHRNSVGTPPEFHPVYRDRDRDREEEDKSAATKTRPARLPVLKPAKAAPLEEPPEFAELVRLYPGGRKGDLKTCLRLFLAATRPPTTRAEAERAEHPPVSSQEILEGARGWKANRWDHNREEDWKFEPMLEKWIRERRWRDVPIRRGPINGLVPKGGRAVHVEDPRKAFNDELQRKILAGEIIP